VPVLLTKLKALNEVAANSSNITVDEFCNLIKSDAINDDDVKFRKLLISLLASTITALLATTVPGVTPYKYVKYETLE